MRDLFLLGFLAGFMALGLRRPFLLVLAYIYVDTVSPHHLSWGLLSAIPLSMITAALAMGAWLLFDAKSGIRIALRQWIMGLLLLWAGYTTLHAALPVEALEKWDWVWKTLLFALFLPFTLRTRLRIEACVLILVLSAGTLVINGGIKTVLGGGGYGQLRIFIDSNSGLFESSTLSSLAIALIPLVLWLARYGTIFPPDWRSKAFAAGLVLACLLIPVGTEARTGLVCVAVLAVLMLRDVKRRFLYMGAAAFIGLAAIPFLPASFQERMGLIKGYETDSSASSRIAVWGWTLDYTRDNPLGGGFGVYRLNRLQVQTVESRTSGDVTVTSAQTFIDEGRAWHSAYFEMLGETGYPGLLLFLSLHLLSLVRMEVIRRRYAKAEGDKAWIAPLATALQHFQIIYLVGALFVAIAFNGLALMVVAAQIGLDNWVRRQERAERKLPSWGKAEPVGAATA